MSSLQKEGLTQIRAMQCEKNKTLVYILTSTKNHEPL